MSSSGVGDDDWNHEVRMPSAVQSFRKRHRVASASTTAAAARDGSPKVMQRHLQYECLDRQDSSKRSSNRESSKSPPRQHNSDTRDRHRRRSGTRRNGRLTSSEEAYDRYRQMKGLSSGRLPRDGDGRYRVKRPGSKPPSDAESKRHRLCSEGRTNGICLNTSDNKYKDKGSEDEECGIENRSSSRGSHKFRKRTSSVVGSNVKREHSTNSSPDIDRDSTAARSRLRSDHRSDYRHTTLKDESSTNSRRVKRERSDRHTSPSNSKADSGGTTNTTKPESKREVKVKSEPATSSAYRHMKLEHVIESARAHRKAQEHPDDNNNTRPDLQHDTPPNDGSEPKKVEEPNFEVTGLLAAETSTRNGVVLKHSSPPEGRTPDKRWRLYMFKGNVGDEPSKILHLHRQQCYLVGKDPRVADVLLLHPTISKQHAVIQYRMVKGEVRPYLIDLGSVNGSFLNGTRIEKQRYYELLEQDMLRFGRSTRDLLLLHTKSEIDL
eukprot:Lankesteria_metandrocarpae@DN4938_c0_g1_i1.p1